MKNSLNVKVIKIDNIKIHPEVEQFVKPKKCDHIECTMEKFGQFTPLIGNQVGDEFYVTDGVVRLELAKKLGWESLECLHINISDEDIITSRLCSNQKTKMTYSEMAHYAEHVLGILGLSQGKKRTRLGMEDLFNDTNFGFVGKDRFELACHLLDLPVKASSLRKLIEVYHYSLENDDAGIMKNLDEGIDSLNGAFNNYLKDKKIGNRNQARLNRIAQIQNSNTWYKIFNQCATDLSNLKIYNPKFCMFSPPYWLMKEYRNQGEMKYGRESTLEQYIANSKKIIDSLTSIMDKNGIVVIVIGESYSGGYKGVINEYESMLKTTNLEVIGKCPWIKTNPTPVNVDNFFRPADETIFVCKMRGAEPIFDPKMEPTKEGKKGIKNSHKGKNGAKRTYLQDDKRIILNVIETPVCNPNEYKKYDPNFHHDAPCPMAVYEAFVESYTEPGMTALDIHSGAAQGLEVFARWGCNAIGVDIDPVSVDFGKKRMDMVLGEKNKLETLIAA